MSNVVKDDYSAGNLLKKYRENGQPRGKRSNGLNTYEPVLTNQRARFVEISIRKFSTVPKTREGDEHFGTLYGSGTAGPVKLWPSKI